MHTGLGLEPGLPGQEEEELQEGSPHWTTSGLLAGHRILPDTQ